MEKRFHNHYYSQTNPKKQTKQTIKLNTQPKKEVVHKHSTTTIKKTQTSLAIIAKLNKKEEREID
jgi:hypothetical protein